MKNKITAALLAIFLGGIGIHRFYLNQNGLGLMYLLFFWTFIPAIAAVIDFVIFLTMSDKEFNQKYNSGMQTSGFEDNNRQYSDAHEIERLYNLKNRGIISQEEFDRSKAKFL